MKEYNAIDFIAKSIDFFTAYHCEHLNKYHMEFKKSLTDTESAVLDELEIFIRQLDDDGDINLHAKWKNLILGSTDDENIRKNLMFSHHLPTRSISLLISLEEYNISSEQLTNATRINQAIRELQKLNIHAIGSKKDISEHINNEQRQELVQQWNKTDIMQCLNQVRKATTQADFKQIEKQYLKQTVTDCISKTVHELKKIINLLITNNELSLSAYNLIYNKFTALGQAVAFQKIIFQEITTLKKIIKQDKNKKASASMKLFKIKQLQLQHKLRIHPEVLAQTRVEPTSLRAIDNIRKNLSTLNLHSLFNDYIKLYNLHNDTKTRGMVNFYIIYLRNLSPLHQRQSHWHTLAIIDLAYSEYNDHYTYGKYKQAKQQLLQQLTESIAAGKHYLQLFSEPNNNLIKDINGKFFICTCLKIVSTLQIMMKQSKTYKQRKMLVRAHNEALDCNKNNFSLLQILMTLNSNTKLDYPAMVKATQSKHYYNCLTSNVLEKLANQLNNDIIDEIINICCEDIISEDDELSYTDMHTLKTAMDNIKDKLPVTKLKQLQTILDSIFHTDSDLPSSIAKLTYDKRVEAAANLGQARNILTAIKHNEPTSDIISSDLGWLCIIGASTEAIEEALIPKIPAQILSSIIDLHLHIANKLNKHYDQHSNQAYCPPAPKLV